VVCVVQASGPEVALKVLLGQASHTRSALAVGAVFSYCPALQVRVGPHVRSEELVGATVWYSLTAAHCLVSVQTRSEVAVAAVETNCASPQVARTVHSRSEVPVAAVLVNWDASHSVCVAHVRSDVVEGPAVSYSSPRHSVRSWHTRLEVVVASV
jgi:hypothetical protein